MNRTVFIAVVLFLAVPVCRADTLARDGNGSFIGFYTGIFEHSGVVLVSSKGYRFVVNRDNGWLRGPSDDTSERVYFDGENCTGGAHMLGHTAQYAGVIIPLHGGASFTLQSVYYVPQDAVADPLVKLYSYFEYDGQTGNSTCSPTAPTAGTPILPLLVNDPAVTGVPNSDVVLPLRVTSNTIFGNGFEAASAAISRADSFA